MLSVRILFSRLLSPVRADLFLCHISADPMDEDVQYTYDAQTATRAAQAEREALRSLSVKKLARSLAVPTNDRIVRERLRSQGEPMTLFGEREPDRRERLRMFLAEKEMRQRERRAEAGEQVDFNAPATDTPTSEASQDEQDDASDDNQDEEFFTEPADMEAVLAARRRTALFSLQRTGKRLERERVFAKLRLQDIATKRRDVFASLEPEQLRLLGSQVGDDRAVSMARFSPDGNQLLTTSWSGGVKLWDVPQLEPAPFPPRPQGGSGVWRGHSDRVSGAAWHPGATTWLPRNAANIATGCADGSVALWSLNSAAPLARMTGHRGRVARTAFHPQGLLLASAGFDHTWRLWDPVVQKELYAQEGHSAEVYTVEFQDDGALVASGGLDGLVRIWDVRTGRSAMILSGHASSVLAVDFAPNSWQAATGSDDDTVRIWDLRALGTTYTIPAHTSTVSDLRFYKSRSVDSEAKKSWFTYMSTIGGDEDSMQAMDTTPDSVAEPLPSTEGFDNSGSAEGGSVLPADGLFLATSGYDGMVRLWSADDWQLQRELRTGVDNKVMSLDVSPDRQHIAAVGFDRAIKLWGQL